MLFGQKKPLPQVDYDKKVAPEFLEILSRLEELENNLKKMENSYNLLNLEWSTNLEGYKKELNKIKAELEYFKMRVKKMKNTFLNLVFILRMKSTNEEFDKIKQKVENWPLHKFITLREFLRILNEKISH